MNRNYLMLSYQELACLLNLCLDDQIIRVQDRPERCGLRVYFENPLLPDVLEHSELSGINWKDVQSGET